jgi:hypothetical protein
MVQPHVRGQAVFLVDDAWRDKDLVAAARWDCCTGIRVDGILSLPRGMLVGALTA